MIHSAKFGSIERFFGVLIEHYAGAFPPWLAPGAGRRASRSPSGTTTTSTTSPRSCAPQGIRVEVDDSDDRMQKKIRNAQLQKVPFMLIAGDDDVEAGAVSFRYRDGAQDNGVPVDEAIARDRRSRSSQRVQVLSDPDSDHDAVIRAGRRRACPTTSTGCGRRTGWPTSRARTSRRTVRRASARSAGSRRLDDDEGLIVHRGETAYVGAQPLPLQPRPPDGLPLPARRRLHRPDRRTRRPRSPPDPAGDAGRSGR